MFCKWNNKIKVVCLDSFYTIIFKSIIKYSLKED